MLGSSFVDPVLGVDIHFEMVPTPAPVPTPIPNPFTGIVFDPMGLAAGLILGNVIGAVLGAPFQGPVLYWTAFPATNTGTEAKHVPGHILIPPGTMWAPFPKTPKPVIHPGETPKPALPVKPENDAVCIFGSKTVTVMGSNAVRLGDILLSCSEPVRLPSSVVLAVPKGAPILIGGPPSLDIMAALTASLRTRFMSDSLHALISRLKPSRFRNLLHRVACFFTGHPVDVASGKVTTNFVDADLPGPLPLKIERVYSSAFASRASPIGHGWSISLDQAVWRERGKVVYLAEDGREIEFDTFDLPNHRIEPGQSVWHPIDRLTLRCLKNERWEIESQDGLIRDFSPTPGRDDGRAMIQQIRSPASEAATTFHYDQQGRLAWVRDFAGRRIRLCHDERGRLTALQLPHPDQDGHYTHVRYHYDGNGDLVTVVDALGKSWHFEYVTHLLVRETNRNGLSFYFQYDGTGEDAYCVRTWGDDGIYDHSIAYDKKNHVTFVTNSLGYTKQYHMNSTGLVVKIVDPLGGEVQFEYDPETLQRTKETSPLGASKSTEYDPLGRPTRLIYEDGSSVALEYPAKGEVPHRVVDVLGNTWINQFDHLGRVVAAADPMGRTERYHYQHGRLVAVFDGAGGKVAYRYDKNGNIVEVTNPDGSTVSWECDRLGRPVKMLDVLGNVTTRVYDLLDRLCEVREPDSNHWTYLYDPEGNVLRITDNRRDVSFTYQGMACMASRTEGDTTVRFEYDTEEQPVAVWNQNCKAYRFVLDANGRLAEETGFDGLTRQYTRDVAGQVVKAERPGGKTTQYQYDVNGLLTEIQHADGSGCRFKYRADGALIEASNEAIDLKFEFDAVGQVVKETQGEHWVEHAYNPVGHRVRVRSSLGANIAVTRNEMGDVVGVKHRSRDLRDKAFEVGFSRNALGLELERSLPGGVRSRWERDAIGRPSLHGISANGVLTRAMSFQWGADDRLQTTEDAFDGSTTFGHDAPGNLLWAKYNEQVELRLPDAVGNLFRTTQRKDRRYGPAGQLLEADTDKGVTRYEYDDEGNLIAKHEPNGATWVYTWNDAGMLVKVTRPDGESVDFAYDAFGRRVSKHYRGQTTRWVWDEDLPLHEWVEGELQDPVRAPGPEPLWSSDPWVKRREAELNEHLQRGPPHRGSRDEPITWLFEPETFAPMAKLVGTQQYAIVPDYLGTPVGMFDATGNQTWSARLSVWGQLSELQGDRYAQPFRWPGQYEDAETGLYYNRMRYYDPDAGEYVSQDPLRFLGGLGLYSYVADPNVETDPYGLVTRLLNQNMQNAGRITQPGQTPHHIVQRNGGGPFGTLNRRLLQRNGIGVDDAANGARLWGTHPNQRLQPGHPGRGGASYHGGNHLHGPGNQKFIYRILRAAEKKGLDVSKVLEDIGRRMEADTWKDSQRACGH